MSKERYEWYMGTSEIIDNKTKKFITQNCTEVLNKQSKQIADLKAKLAESKEFLIATKWKVEDLQKQLAEKDNLLKMYPRLEDMYPQLPRIVIGDQDKIDYAVEQLERARHNILCNERFYFENLNEYIDEEIDQLITDIKEGK